MYEIEVLDLKKMKPKKQPLYEALLRPGYQYLFDPLNLLDPHNNDLMAVTAKLHQTPVGLIIGEKKFKHLLEIKSLKVLEEHKNRNLPFKMLQALETEFVKHKGHYMQALYPNEPSFLEDWEKTFIQSRWTGKKLAAVECFFADGSAFHPDWYERSYTLPPEFEIFLWKDLTPAEAEEIKIACKNRISPAEVNPFVPGDYEPLNSLGLRHQGKVVGWLITRRYDPNTICYYSIYTDIEFHNKGPIIQLLVHALRIHQNSSFKQAIFRVNVMQLPNLKWLRFVRKRLVPHASRYTEYFLAWHAIPGAK
jgi:hypothetical protein